MTLNNGWRRFIDRTRQDRLYDTIDSYLDKARGILGESIPHQWSHRNKVMAEKINRLHAQQGYNNLAHVGGSGHYDQARCVPLQTLVAAKQIDIIDVVAQQTVRYK